MSADNTNWPLATLEIEDVTRTEGHDAECEMANLVMHGKSPT